MFLAHGLNLLFWAAVQRRGRHTLHLSEIRFRDPQPKLLEPVRFFYVLVVLQQKRIDCKKRAFKSYGTSTRVVLDIMFLQQRFCQCRLLRIGIAWPDCPGCIGSITKTSQQCDCFKIWIFARSKKQAFDKAVVENIASTDLKAFRATKANTK